MKFIMTFSNGVTCETEVPAQKPVKPSEFVPTFAWSCDLTREMFLPIKKEYLSWVICVHQKLADLWGIKLLYVYGQTVFLMTPNNPHEVLSQEQ